MLQIPNKEIIILPESKEEVLARLDTELRRLLSEDRLTGLGLADFGKNYAGRLLKKKTLRKLDEMLENISEAEKTRLGNLVRLTSLYPQNKSERSMDISDSGAEIFIIDASSENKEEIVKNMQDILLIRDGFDENGKPKKSNLQILKNRITSKLAESYNKEPSQRVKSAKEGAARLLKKWGLEESDQTIIPDQEEYETLARIRMGDGWDAKTKKTMLLAEVGLEHKLPDDTEKHLEFLIEHKIPFSASRKTLTYGCESASKERMFIGERGWLGTKHEIKSEIFKGAVNGEESYILVNIGGSVYDFLPPAKRTGREISFDFSKIDPQFENILSQISGQEIILNKTGQSGKVLELEHEIAAELGTSFSRVNPVNILLEAKHKGARVAIFWDSGLPADRLTTNFGDRTITAVYLDADKYEAGLQKEAEKSSNLFYEAELSWTLPPPSTVRHDRRFRRYSSHHISDR